LKQVADMGNEETDAPSAKKTGIVYDPVYKKHLTRPGHPECPERCDAVLAGIGRSVPENRLEHLKARAATVEELLLCHTAEYVESAKADIEAGAVSLRTGDTDVSERSYDAALFAAGGVMAAADAVVSGRVSNAFCVVRPPGHHATRDRGMGFCIFNNIAVAARYLQKQHGIGNVLIVDWDVHHGNGTQDIFYDEPRVFYFSTHQWPFYPGTGTVSETGEGKGKGSTLNCPLPSGSGRKEVVGAFKQKLLPAMKVFKPDFVLISAGFDARHEDLIGNMVLSDGDFGELTEILLQLASEYSGGRVVSVLEGGYRLSGLASSAAAHVKALAGSAGQT
jgi:acetoin utilization deacetylase AcuC-like enzyme